LSNDSKIKIPDPSPITNPSRFLSNGRLAVLGSSLNDKAFIEENPAKAIFVNGDSVLQVIIASTSPRSIALNASPIEFVPEAQAVTEQEFMPLAPVCIDT